MLLIFIDGLQFDDAIKHLNLSNDKNSSRVIPGVGFSNNIYPEMMCGLTPDGIGYFNEWSPRKEVGKQNSLLSILDIFRPSLYINAGIRKIILRKILKLDFSNVPFKYAHYFKPQGSHNFRDLGDGSILNRYNFEIFDAVETRESVGNRDATALQNAINEMHSVNVMVSLTDLDNIAHTYGVGSDRYNKHLAFLNQKIPMLISRYEELNEGENVYAFSDHGMSKVTRVINFEIEKKFGPMSPENYLYFIDSTILRVWSSDDILLLEINEYLNGLDFGDVIDSDEREDFGLTNLEFGNIIFRAKDGVIFVPNFYGGRPVKAMHGYDSNLISQHAFFSDCIAEDSDELPSSSLGIYKFLERKLREK